MDAPRIGNVLYPVPDIDVAVAFYRDAIGLPVKFTDGTDFAGLDGGGVTLALVRAGEDVTGEPAAALRVTDVAAAVERATAAGATLLRGPEQGPHEIRAALRDPAGNVVVLYSPA